MSSTVVSMPADIAALVDELENLAQETETLAPAARSAFSRAALALQKSAEESNELRRAIHAALDAVDHPRVNDALDTLTQVERPLRFAVRRSPDGWGEDYFIMLGS